MLPLPIVTSEFTRDTTLHQILSTFNPPLTILCTSSLQKTMANQTFYLPNSLSNTTISSQTNRDTMCDVDATMKNNNETYNAIEELTQNDVMNVVNNAMTDINFITIDDNVNANEDVIITDEDDEMFLPRSKVKEDIFHQFQSSPVKKLVL